MISKRFTRKIFHKLGYEIRKVSGGQDLDAPDIWTWLRTAGGINTIIDIGANNGEFAEFLSSYFGANRTIAIEPLPECAAQIRKRNKAIKNLSVLQYAVSDCNGKSLLFENDYSPASSLLQISTDSIREFPQTTNVKKQIEIEVKCLDDLIDLSAVEKEILIKIDVQGFEDKAINGGKKVFSAAKFVIIEMSFVPMYDGQPLFEDINKMLVDIGFRLSGIKNQINSASTGQPLFLHCLYSR